MRNYAQQDFLNVPDRIFAIPISNFGFQAEVAACPLTGG
jgi:hypothetical protein